MNNFSVCVLLLAILSINNIHCQTNSNKYQEILDRATQNGLPAIAALIQASGESEWKGSSGFSSVEEAIPLDINQSFRLASITKIFTTLVVLQLVDEQKIKLTDNIALYLDTEIKNKIPYIESINILQLLSHSSGIYSFTENNDFWKEGFFEGGMSRTWKPEELIGYIDNKRPVSKPLAAYSKKMYSNTNFILLGMIIEKVTGNQLSEEYQTRIFSKLKMANTFLEGYDIQGRKPVDAYAIPNSSFLKSAVRRNSLKSVSDDKLINLSKEYSLFNSWGMGGRRNLFQCQ